MKQVLTCICVAAAVLAAGCITKPTKKYEGSGADTTVTEMRVFALSSCPVTDPNRESALLAAAGTAAAGAVANLVVDWVSKGISSAKEKSKGSYDSGKVFANSPGFYRADADKPTMKPLCIIVAHATYGSKLESEKRCSGHADKPGVSSPVFDRACASGGVRADAMSAMGILSEPNFYAEFKLHDLGFDFAEIQPVYLSQTKHPADSMWNPSGKGTANVVLQFLAAGEDPAKPFLSHPFIFQDLKNGIVLDAARLPAVQAPYFKKPAIGTAESDFNTKYTESRKASKAALSAFKDKLTGLRTAGVACTGISTPTTLLGCPASLDNITMSTGDKASGATFPADVELNCQDQLNDIGFLRNARAKLAECDRVLDAAVWTAASEDAVAGFTKDQVTETAAEKLRLAQVKQEFIRRKASLTAIVDAASYGFSNCVAINEQAEKEAVFGKKDYFNDPCPTEPALEISKVPEKAPEDKELVPFTVILQATWTKDPNAFLNALDKAVSENKDDWETSIKDKLAYKWDPDFREKKDTEEAVADLTQKIALQDAIDKANKQYEVWKESEVDGKSAPSAVLGNKQLYEKYKREANLAHVTAGLPPPFTDMQ